MNIAISIFYFSFVAIAASAGYIFDAYADWSIATICSAVLFYVLSVATNLLTSNVAAKTWLLFLQAILLLLCSLMLWLHYTFNSNLALLASILVLIISVAITSISLLAARNQDG